MNYIQKYILLYNSSGLLLCMIFNCFSGRGFELVYKAADDPGLTLSKHGEYLYENLILFSPTVEGI